MSGLEQALMLMVLIPLCYLLIGCIIVLTAIMVYILIEFSISLVCEYKALAKERGR